MGDVVSFAEYRNRKAGANVTPLPLPSPDPKRKEKLEDEPDPQVGDVWVLSDGNSAVISLVRDGFVLGMPLTEGHSYADRHGLLIPLEQVGWDCVIWPAIETGMSVSALSVKLGNFFSPAEVTALRKFQDGSGLAPFPVGTDETDMTKFSAMCAAFRVLCFLDD